jgi:BACON domain-containing protein/all-beta uncharacterized protein
MRSRVQLLAATVVCTAIAALGISCGGDSPTTPTPVPTCSFSVTSSTASIPASGGSGSIHIDTSAGCSWTARADVSWITVSPASGTGAADVAVTARANEAVDGRSGQVTVADKPVMFRQEGKAAASCEFALDPASQTWGSTAAHGRVTLQTGDTCAWTARSLDDWVTVRTATGTGSGAIDYDVPAYTGTQQRETRIVVGGASAIVRQDPPALSCSYAVDPTSSTMHWHGGALDVRVTTGAGCTWTAAAGADWMALTSAGSGAGSTAVSVSISEFTQDATRSTPLMIRWPTETAGQNVHVTQEGCRYAIAGPTDVTIAAAGGTAEAYVIEQALSASCNIPCRWTAEPQVPWIHIVSGSPGAGYDRFSYRVDANTTAAARTGIINVMGHALTITQTP